MQSAGISELGETRCTYMRESLIIDTRTTYVSKTGDERVFDTAKKKVAVR